MTANRIRTKATAAVRTEFDYFPPLQGFTTVIPFAHPRDVISTNIVWRASSVQRAIILPAVMAAALWSFVPLIDAATPAPKNAEAYIIWPSDGTVINGGKFWMRMGLRNMGVAPRGTERPNVGHHHVLIDTDPPPPGEAIPSDRNNLHFGAGETEARIELPPGKHTLQLVMGDHDHIPHDPPIMSKKITVTVR
jgi:hypothetical protein